MINQLAKRPQSSHKTSVRPITSKASEESIKQSNECFEKGKKHMNKKQYDQALKHYMNATIHNPQNFKALCNMGTIYKQTGKYGEAKMCYRKALVANPNDHISLYNLGNLQRLSGNDETALSLYTRVINLKQLQNKDVGTTYCDSLVNQGICYKNLKLYDQAISCCQKALQLNPNDYSIHFNNAMFHLNKIYFINKFSFKSVQKKLCTQTQPLFLKIIALNPNNFTAKLALVQLKYLQNLDQQTLSKSIKQFQTLKKQVPQSQKFQVQIKIKYCQNQLRKIQQKNQPNLTKQEKQALKQSRGGERKQTNKYDQQALQGKQKTIHVSQKPVQKQSKPEEQKNQIKQVKIQNKVNKTAQKIDQKKQQKKSTLPPRKIDKKQIQDIYKLLDEKKYDEAFNLAKDLPSCPQKFEVEIICNFLESEQTESQALLQAALAIYLEHIMKYKQQTPITKQTCSQRGHEVMANMLNIAQNYAQASKHYQVLLQILQDQKLNQNNGQKIQQIHAGLGVCYAERGLLQEAIKQYKQSYDMQPDNYFLMTTLCGLLIESGQKEAAKKYYDDFLKKNNGQNMTDKVAYIDALLCISICQADTPEYQKAVIKAIEAVQKYFPSHEDISKNLDTQAILSLYLRYIDILEKKIDEKNKNEVQKKQIYDKMLDTYLTCLQYQNCPDRQAISLNAGIIFYLSGCYANALAFYKAVTVNKKIVANNMGLAFIHLQQYEKALGYFIFAVQQYPESIIYATNLEIAKWICGINQKQPFQKYICKCQPMFQIRVTLGLWMLDQLTVMIDKNQIKVQNQPNSTTSVKQQVDSLLLKIAQRIQNFKSNKQTQANKINHICGILDKHIRQYHNQQQKPKYLIPLQIRDLCLKKCADIKQMEQNMSKLVQYLQQLKNCFTHFTIVQISIALFFISNSHLTHTTQNIKEKLVKKSIHNITKSPQHLKSPEASQQTAMSVVKTTQINYPTVQLKLKLLQNIVRDAQCMIQNTTQYLIQHIENVYYSKTDNIFWPLIKQFTHPHCDNSQKCQRCIVNSIHLYSSLFDKKMDLNQIKLNQNWNFKKQIDAIPKAIEIFVQKCLESQEKNIFSKATKTLTIKLQQKNLPFRLKTFHKKFQNVLQFIEKIDKTFKISPQKQISEKGIRIVQMNNNLILEMYWGQSLTIFDKFWHQFLRRQTNITQDALLLMGDSAQTAYQQFECPDESKTKISDILGMK